MSPMPSKLIPVRTAGGSSGGGVDATALHAPQNLADVPDKAAARGNLQLASAAQQPTSAFDAAGAASAAVTAAGATALQRANNLADLANAATARTRLGLDTAALSPATDFAPAAGAVPVGGTTDQALLKASNADRALKWGTVSGGSGGIAKTGDTGLSGSYVWRDAAAASEAINLGVGAETTAQPRFRVQADGRIAWGPGNAAGDAYVYRNAAQTVTLERYANVTHSLNIGGSGAGLTDVTLKVTGASPWRYGAQLDVGIVPTGSGTAATQLYVRGNIQTGTYTIPDWHTLRLVAGTKSGSGSVTNCYALLVESPNFGTALNLGVAVTAAGTQTLWLSSDADNTTASAGIAFGLSRDTKLYRSAASTLKTDGSLALGDSGGNLLPGATTGSKLGTAANQKLGFWGATPVVQNTGWAATAGYTALRNFDPANASMDDAMRVIATLVDTLKAYGILGA
jgi:hypothetical protein